MFLHPELVLREQQRRHSELISAMATERRAAAARPPRHRFSTMARLVRTYASAGLWRHIILAAFTRHRIPAIPAIPAPANPERMAPTTPRDTPKAAAASETNG